MRLVCENERLRLMCKNDTVLAIYSATFGHLLHGSPYCPQEPGSHTNMGLTQGAQESSSGNNMEKNISSIDTAQNNLCALFIY